MEPQNIIIGDSTGFDLPQSEIDEETLVEEKKMAKFTRTGEYKRIAEWCEGRIAFYQTFLPDGREVGMDKAPTPEDWAVANRVIAELKALMNAYEIATAAVKDSGS